MSDFKFAFRQLLKNPGFTAVAVLTLALGIGANTAIFNLVNALFLKPPSQVSAPERLILMQRLKVRDHNTSVETFSYPDFLYYRDHNSVFTGLASFCSGYLADGQKASEVDAQIVSDNYFSVLGVQTYLGRFFVPEECVVPNRNPVVVLGYEFWQRRFDGDTNCLGQTLPLGGTAFIVVGVAPRGFQGAQVGTTVDVWIPVMMANVVYRDCDIQSRDQALLELIGRLGPRRTIVNARAEASVLARQLADSYPDTNQGTSVRLTSPRNPFGSMRIDDALRGGEKLPMPAMIVASVGCLLLIACANLAGLLLARSSSRQKEFAIRLAVGAKRSQLVRQLLTECVLLSVLGGSAGLLVATCANPFFESSYAGKIEGLKPAYDLSFDTSAVVFGILLSVITGLLFGLAPAFQSTRLDLVPKLKDNASASQCRGSRLRAALITAQVALSLTLLIGSGLMLRSLHTLVVNPGFDPRSVVFMRMKPHLAGYGPKQAKAYFQQVLRRLEALSDVESVAFAQFPPVRNWAVTAKVSVPGHKSSTEGGAIDMPLNRVTAAFFHTVGMPLLKGRDFDDSDYERSPRVIVVNRDFAEHFWPGGDCLGRTILVDDKPHEIMGVVPYDNFRRSGEGWRPFLFQLEFGSNRMFVHVKGDAQRIRPLLREEIMRVDPKVPISEELSLMEMIRNFFMPVTLTLGVLGFASVLGVLLSAIALYGTLALNVTQRTREIGIRMALGERRSAVVCNTLQEGMGLAGLGIVLGLAGGFGLTCLLRRLLYGIGTTDVATAAAAMFILAVVALLACWLPARRAARIHPMEALRYE